MATLLSYWLTHEQTRDGWTTLEITAINTSDHAAVPLRVGDEILLSINDLYSAVEWNGIGPLALVLDRQEDSGPKRLFFLHPPEDYVLGAGEPIQLEIRSRQAKPSVEIHERIGGRAAVGTPTLPYLPPTPPPLLTYALLPRDPFEGLPAFALTITNPSGGDAVTLRPSDEILFAIKPGAGENPNYTAVRFFARADPFQLILNTDGLVLVAGVRPFTDHVLKEGDSVVLTFKSPWAHPSVQVQERIGKHTGVGNAMSSSFTYQMVPAQAFVALPTNFTLIATNSTENAITLKAGRQGDQIQVTFPMPPAFTGANALIDTANFVATPPTGFLAGQQSSGSATYIIQPSPNDQTVQPGASVKVTFTQVPVNGTPGTPTIQITDYIGGNTGNTSVPVTKLAQELNIIAWLDPYLIALGQTSMLYWQSFGGTNVEIINFPGNPPSKNFPVTGSPPSPGNTIVTLTPTEPNRPYTAKVTTGDGRHAQTQLTLAYHEPIVTSFGPGGPLNVGPADQVPLTWTTLYTTRAYLQTSVGGAPTPVASNPLQPVMVTPGTDALNGAADWQSIPGQVAYTVVATGYGRNAQGTPITVNIGPVKALYLKYLRMDNTGKLSVIAFATDPPGWKAAQANFTSNGATYAVYQPGGTVTTLYLAGGDTVHPQVQYFNATAGAGGTFTLTWVTANATALTLAPVGYTVPTGSVAKGSYDVKPTATTDYVLTAAAKSGETVTSTLRVTV
jgi:hypothetical protein